MCSICMSCVRDTLASLILYCCLTHSSCAEVTQWWGLHVVRGEKYGESASSCKLQLYHVPCVLQSAWCAASVQQIHIGPCVIYLIDCFTELEPGSQFLCCACVCTFCVIFSGLKAQSHSDAVMCMQLLCGQYVYDFTYACPTLSCIPLVPTVSIPLDRLYSFREYL